MRRSVIAILFVAAAAVFVYAGDLNPPAGPVAPTAKPLAEIEPRIAINATNTPGNAAYTYVISAPGSYYLTEPLTTATDMGGIEVTSAHVNIDLNGFRINHGGGSAIVFGINASSRNQLTVRNGTIQNFTDDGINAGQRCVIENVRVLGNDGLGIFLRNDSVVRNCIARQNSSGIRIEADGIIDGCIADDQTFVGIGTGEWTVVTNCRASGNGVDGIQAQDGTIISGCSFSNNTGAGIQFFGDVYIHDNICTNNAIGIFGGQAGDAARIDSNHLVENDVGMEIDGRDNIIVRNTARANSMGNYDIGPNNRVGTLSTDPVGAGPWDNFDY